MSSANKNHYKPPKHLIGFPTLPSHLCEQIANYSNPFATEEAEEDATRQIYEVAAELQARHQPAEYQKCLEQKAVINSDVFYRCSTGGMARKGKAGTT